MLVYDNDTPGVYVTHVEPGTTVLDDRGIVIEGDAATQRTDDVLVQLAKDPAPPRTPLRPGITVKITMDADSQRILQIDDAAAEAALGIRWTAVPRRRRRHALRATFTTRNWNIAVRSR